MKILINKQLLRGIYKVHIKVEGLSTDEANKMAKFGVPYITISPQSVLRSSGYVNSLPITNFDETFSFSERDVAESFIAKIKKDIDSTMATIRGLDDNFSDKEDYEV